MRRDPQVAYDGLSKITAGVQSAVAPIVLPRNQLAWATNIDCRTDFVRPRPGWVKRPLTFLDDEGAESAVIAALFEDAIFQGGIVFERFSQIITMIGGHLFRIDPGSWTVTDVSTAGDYNAPDKYRAWFCEAESWVIAQDGVSIPWIYDGAAAVRSDTLGAGGKPQVPIGKAMCYSQGRLIVSYATGRAFVIGDIVGGDSGTAPYDFKDSVLYFTENDIINGGGSFSVPINAGLITAFRPIAQIDTSMGQGPTQVFTTNAIFSLNTPVDRTTWATVNFPIGTVSNVSNGALSDRCTPNVNGDIWFRAPDGIRAFMVARRDFQAAWVNAPLSHEVERALTGEDDNYLGYASASLFDNRLLFTTRPYRVWDHGIVHQGLIQLDFEPVTSLSERNPLPTWLGNVTGLRVLQMLSGNIAGIPRCFIFALNEDDKIELWEITKQAVADDNGVDSVPIEWTFETAAFSFASQGGTGADPSALPGRELWSLDGGRLYVDEIEGDVSFSLQFRPDQDPCWHDWHSWSICATNATCGEGTDCLSAPPNLRQQYRRPFFLPQPRAGCDPSTDKPYHIGREFQVRAVIVGKCRIKMLELVAHAQEEDVTGICAGNEECVAVSCCPPNDYAYQIPDAPVPPPAATGACCIDGACSVATEAECVALGGTYYGDDTTCEPDPCGAPPATGACCIDGECSVLTEAACVAAGGTYQGDDTSCRDVVCQPPLPVYPPPTPYDCPGRTVWAAITVTDQITGETKFVGINPGVDDPNDYVNAHGPAGCLAGWAAEVWSQFLGAGIPYSQARLIWESGPLTDLNFTATSVFPDMAGNYQQVILLNTFITVEYCPP